MVDKECGELQRVATRREFIQLGAVGCVAVITGAVTGVEASLLRPFVPQHSPALVIYEADDAFGRAFARKMLGPGVTTRAIVGDVSDVWSGESRTAWRNSPLPVVGLTGCDALFCLERLAWTVGRRLKLARHFLTSQQRWASFSAPSFENSVPPADPELRTADFATGVAHVSQLRSAWVNRVLWVIGPPAGVA